MRLPDWEDVIWESLRVAATLTVLMMALTMCVAFGRLIMFMVWR